MCARLRLGLARPALPARGCAVPVAPPSATTTQQGEHVRVRASAGITLRSLLPLPPPRLAIPAPQSPRDSSFHGAEPSLFVTSSRPNHLPRLRINGSHGFLQIYTFGRFLAAHGPRSSSSMLALFSAAPPQATQTLFRLSLCRHAYTACELRTSASISPPPLQVRVRGARRPASEAAAAETAVAAAAAAAAAVCGL